MALGVPGRLRPRIFSTFGTTRVVGRQPNAPAAFTPWEIPGTHFQWLSRPQGTWFCRKEPRKKSQVIPPGIDPRTVRLVAQRLNHYATPGTPFSPLLCFVHTQAAFSNDDTHMFYIVFLLYLLFVSPGWWPRMVWNMSDITYVIIIIIIIIIIKCLQLHFWIFVINKL